MKPGTRVKILPLDKEWHDGAAKSLSGMLGEVRCVNERTGLVLVQFDSRPKAWHANQIPSECWWFEPRELEQINK